MKKLADITLVIGFTIVICATQLDFDFKTDNKAQTIKYTTQNSKTFRRANGRDIEGFIETYDYITHPTYTEEQEQIRDEIFYGDVELLAILIQAEAGNQDVDGKRLVADVVLNRVDAGFENNIEMVIYQSGQFTSVTDGNFERASYQVTQQDFDVAYEEMTEQRLDSTLLYFSAEGYSEYGTPAYEHGDHFFSTK